MLRPTCGFALPFNQKMKLVIACVIVGSLLSAGIGLFIVRHDISWMQNCEAGLAARENCNFALAEQKLLAAASAAAHFSPADERRYLTNLSLAQMYVAIGNFARAKEFIEKIRSAADASNNVQHKLTVMSLFADYLYRQGKFEEARKVYTAMVELAGKNQQTIFEIDTQIALTKLDIMASKRAEAEERMNSIDALNLKLKAPTNTGLVLSIYMCLVAELKGRYKTALQLYENAEHIAQNQNKPSSALILAIANNSCTFYLQDRNLVRAKNIGQRALENCEKNFESYFAGNLLHALRNMSSVSLADNDNRRARQFIDRELDEVGKRLSHEHPFYGVALEHRAVLESREGKKDESDKDFNACQEIFAKSFGVQNRFSADTLLEIARIQLNANDFTSSTATCKRAIAMYKTVLPNDHPSGLRAMEVLAQNYRKQNKSDLAVALEREVHEAFNAADGK